MLNLFHASPSLKRLIRRGSAPYAILALFGLVLALYPANAQTVRRWREPEKYDQGVQPSVVVLPTGLVVEFHCAPPALLGSSAIWYHIGKISHGGIQWGPSQKMDLKAKDVSWPQVAVTPQGQVIFTYSTSLSSLRSDLMYWTGRIQPDGDTSQTIDWAQKEMKYDTGFHNNLALAPFYRSGKFVDVHESDGTARGLYYRVGYLEDDLRVSWLTASNGVKYESGINPHMAINQDNQVVEVHQVTGEQLLHYRRGWLHGELPGLAAIDFQNSVRYNNQAEAPAVAFIGRQTLVEMHNERGYGLRFSVGTLNPGNQITIDWTPPAVISPNDSAFGNPSVTSNGKYAVAVFSRNGGYNQLYYSVAEVEQ